MFDVYPCTICGEAGHTVGRCNELWQNKTPPPERGHGDEEDDSLNFIHYYLISAGDGKFIRRISKDTIYPNELSQNNFVNTSIL